MYNSVITKRLNIINLGRKDTNYFVVTSKISIFVFDNG